MIELLGAVLADPRFPVIVAGFALVAFAVGVWLVGLTGAHRDTRRRRP